MIRAAHRKAVGHYRDKLHAALGALYRARNTEGLPEVFRDLVQPRIDRVHELLDVVEDALERLPVEVVDGE